MTERPYPARLVTTAGDMQVLLRPAREDDAGQMLANLESVSAEGIYLAMEQPPWGTAELGNLIEEAQRRSLIFVTEVRDRVVGDCWMLRGKLEKTTHACSLGMHIVRPFRGLGIGRAMVEYGLSWAKQSGLAKVFLSVFETNERAIRLYKSCGFVEEGRRPRQYIIGGQAVSEVLMGLLL